jgi:hypothetical protein
MKKLTNFGASLSLTLSMPSSMYCFTFLRASSFLSLSHDSKEVANTKFDHDTKPLFGMSKEIAGKKPRVLITDGLIVYHAGYMKEFYTHKLETRT